MGAGDPSTEYRGHSSSASRPHNKASGSSLSSGTNEEFKNDNQTPPDSSFLAPVNFDDFHNSITLKEPSLNNFPMPGHGGTDGNFTEAKTTLRSSNTQSSSIGNKPQTRLSRRNSNASRSKTGQNASATTSMPPPPPPSSSRARRQSYVPSASPSVVSSRPPRKSVGPGAFVPDSDQESVPRRRPSFGARKSMADSSSISQGQRSSSNRSSQRNSDSNPAEVKPGLLPTPRYQKSKSLQPPSRSKRDSLATSSNGSDNDNNRTTSKSGNSRTTTPSSAKRMSVIPPNATGLGARTISPTDARRMKRLSLMPQGAPMPHTPPIRQPSTSPRPRSSAQSPSLIPRKSVTPSSSRTTPDPNRKSYSSGISLSSNTSYNSARNSNGSLQRLSQNMSASRLPTPKPRLDTNSNDAEDVPPVPAIPKAYESPRADGDFVYSTPRQSSLPPDLELSKTAAKSDTDLNITPNSGSNASQVLRKSFDPALSTDAKSRAMMNSNRKHLQPLKLPPLNLLPLSTPVTKKIDSLREKEGVDAAARVTDTPPPTKLPSKTPTTPMTASKATFFSHSLRDLEQPFLNQDRSSSSHLAIRPNTSGYRAENSSSAIDSLDVPSRTARAISPYMSSSLPKASGEFEYLRHQALPGNTKPQTKSTGPRPQTQVSGISPLSEASVWRQSYEENESESSLHSQDRKSSSDKSTEKPSQDEPASTEEPPKYECMPPPKIPASATWNNLSTPQSNSNDSKPTYLTSRRKLSLSNVTSGVSRRKSSIGAEKNTNQPTATPPDSTDSDNQQNKHPSLLSPVHKLLSGSRSAPSKVRPQDLDLDKDDLSAEDEMRKLGSKRNDLEKAAKSLDDLRRRASPKERVSAAQALKMANLNIFERGEIIDFKDIYFCGTHKAKKHIGDLNLQAANFGYDDDRGDYNIVIGDHLAYRYEIVDVLGKGSFGQVVRCVDHKTGALVAVKIIRNKKRFHQQALVEVNILQKLKEWVSGLMCRLNGIEFLTKYS